MRSSFQPGRPRLIGLGAASLLASLAGLASCVSHPPDGEAESYDRVASALTTCAFSPTCPPGEYNTTPTGYVLGSPATGCSTTPPAACQTGTSLPLPPFTAPIIASVANPSAANVPATSAIVPGAHTIYAIGVAAPASQVSASDHRSAVFAWGDNTYGQLGDGTTTSSTMQSAPAVPIYIPDHPVTQIAAGDTDACALLAGPDANTNGNVVYCWGQIMTTPGAVSYPTAKRINLPAADPWVKRIAHGQHHACALSTTGNVYCWGDNDKGQLGVGAVALDPNAPLGVDPGATPVKAVALPPPNPNTTYPQTILDIAASGDSTCILATVVNPSSTNGQKFVTGSNYVWCWGDDEQDALGDGQGTQGNVMSLSSPPTQNTPVFVQGIGGMAVPFMPPLVGGSNGAPGKAGSFCVKTVADGSSNQPWYCWGADWYGQLDLPFTMDPTGPFQSPGNDQEFQAGVKGPVPPSDGPTQKTQFLALGANHACAGVQPAGVGTGTAPVYCFGDNDNNQLGIPGSDEAQIATGTPWVPVNVGNGDSQAPVFSSLTGLTAFNQVGVGLDFTCGANSGAAASANGNIACWGYEGTLLNASTPTFLNWQAKLPTRSPLCILLHVICPGGTQRVCLPEDGGCCNYACEAPGTCSTTTTVPGTPTACPPGQYANNLALTGSNPGCSFIPTTACAPGSPVATTPIATQVAAGANAVYVIGSTVGVSPNTTSAVYAWGDNSYYQLGDGTTTSSTKTSAPAVPLFDPNHGVTEVVAGDTDACGLLSDGSVHCWGEIMSFPGEITYDTQQQISTTDGSALLATSITHGSHHACALSQSPVANRVYCWGNNDKGQLGIDPNQYPGVDPTAPAFSAGPTGISVDPNSPNAVVFPSSVIGKAITSLVAAGDSTCALFGASGGVYCWGDNAQGSLGDGKGAPKASRFNPLPINGATLPSNATISALVGGGNGSPEEAGSFCAQVASTVGTTTTTKWYCWGADRFGQLDALPAPATYPSTNFVEGLSSPTLGADAAFNSAGMVALGAHHACAATNVNGVPTMSCFGNDDQGQLGFVPASGSATSAVNVNSGAGTVPVQTSAMRGIPPMAPWNVAGIPGFNRFAIGKGFTCGLYVPNGTPNWGNMPLWGNVACWGAFGPVVSSSMPTLLTWSLTAGTCQQITGATSDTTCGCNTASDCPGGQACDTSTHICGSACDGATTTNCNGGCCSNGTCSAGTAANACGSTGGACAVCSTACMADSTGKSTCTQCGAAKDCPAYEACGTAYTCGTSCDDSHPCNKGCCDAGVCVGGTAFDACGSTGGACDDCSEFGEICRTTGTVTTKYSRCMLIKPPPPPPCKPATCI